MKDDYLWDRSGEPDPDVTRLEGLLEPLRHRPGALDFSRVPRRLQVAPRFWTRGRGALAIAASVTLVVAVGTWAGWRGLADRRSTPWVATTRPGTSTPETGRTGGPAGVAPGEWIETGPSSSLQLTATEVGTVEVRPGTRLRVLRTRPGQYRLALVRGSLHARIWAPPGQFAVETPSATALDLGCSYTIEVDARGEGGLHVLSGWVGLDSHGVESLVPQGATCRLRDGLGPGTPYFDDAPAALIEALSRLDAPVPAAGRGAVDAAVAAARPRDAFTLWHLLRRLDGRDAAVAYEKLVALAPPPAVATRERVLAKDREALEAWWDTLGLGSSRLFKAWRARPGL